jgi:hypothetical protein
MRCFIVLYSCVVWIYRWLCSRLDTSHLPGRSAHVELSGGAVRVSAPVPFVRLVLEPNDLQLYLEILTIYV